MSLTLSTKQVVFLRSRAHTLEARLTLGKQGASDGFRSKLEAALRLEELVKLRVGRRVEVDIPALAAEIGAVIIQRVGRTAVLYRPGVEPTIELPEP